MGVRQEGTTGLKDIVEERFPSFPSWTDGQARG